MENFRTIRLHLHCCRSYTAQDTRRTCKIKFPGNLWTATPSPFKSSRFNLPFRSTYSSVTTSKQKRIAQKRSHGTRQLRRHTTHRPRVVLVFSWAHYFGWNKVVPVRLTRIQPTRFLAGRSRLCMAWPLPLAASCKNQRATKARSANSASAHRRDVHFGWGWFFKIYTKAHIPLKIILFWLHFRNVTNMLQL